MKKGFTLIELLAVILILGIIALIAIPTVNNILKEARRGAFSSTLTNIEKAIENECTLSKIKNKDINNIYTISNGIISPNVDIKGNLPDGTIYLNNECELSYALFNNNFTGNKELGEETVISDKISGRVYKEQILNGTDPILSDNLIPVRIEKDGTVVKANLNSKWYSYNEKKWANAVILTPNGKVEDNGIILEESIESYFVWIPRYKYKLFDLGNYNNVLEEEITESKVKTIEIVFENKNIEKSIGTAVGEYHSHPAFQAFNSNGFWVGKFETTGDTSNITIKPNQSSFSYLNVKTMFELSYNYKRNNDSHMMKNTEWGAVAYLSMSEYGINKELNINNNSNGITGYSAAMSTNQSKYPGTYGTDSSVTLPYNTETGYLASTTGNISGIYDMSGGLFEYMASYRDNNLGNSGFETNPTSIYNEKYFDIYPNDGSITNYNHRILGDATGELGPFYFKNGFYVSSWGDDVSGFVSTLTPWVGRGGFYNYGSFAGILYFSRNAGEAMNDIGFRISIVK